MPKITKKAVDAAIPNGRDYVIWDSELPGFGLRVFASGKRSYVLQYRSLGRSRRYTIGLHGVWTPESARLEAKAQLGRIARGDNPAEEKQLDHQALTVKQLCDLYRADLEAGLILGKGGRPKKANDHLHRPRKDQTPHHPVARHPPGQGPDQGRCDQAAQGRHGRQNPSLGQNRKTAWKGHCARRPRNSIAHLGSIRRDPDLRDQCRDHRQQSRARNSQAQG